MSYDFCILGAGIAGLSLADSLQDASYEIVVIEKNEIGSGASGTPGGLVNPATGRRATKTWKAEACYKAINQNLDKVAPYAEQPFFRRNGVLRPAITEKMARKMRERYRETHWPDGWCDWLSAGEIKERHPGINCIEGGLWLPVGITIDCNAYLQAYGSWLESQGVAVLTGKEANIQHGEKSWTLDVGNQTIRAKNLVYATGYGTLSASYWSDLPLHPIKGQVARFRTKNMALDFTHSISSLGYIARLQNDSTFIQGSTYEHDFDNIQTSDFGEEYLRGRLKRTLPEVEADAIITEQWAGVRVSTPNRKPVLGKHPEYDNLHLFTGLGSKGLLYGKMLADHYAEYLTKGTPLFKEVDISRFFK